MTQDKPYRVLSLDGGGMRGVYTASYLEALGACFAKQRDVDALDVGSPFDLIVGTSVGGIVACALAAQVSLERVVALFRDDGARIFRRKMPGSLLAAIRDAPFRPASLERGEAALRETLENCFGDETLGGLYDRRSIALAIPAIEMSRHKSWVFKTRHQPGSNGRDDLISLVDVCLATSAAPVYRSIAAVDYGTGTSKTTRYFTDGGLWANNPVLVALVEALGAASPSQPIQVFSVGTCGKPTGETLVPSSTHRGLPGWRFGSEAASLSIDAQEFAFDNMARMFAQRMERECQIVRFPRDVVPASMNKYLDLDETRSEALEALMNQAKSDADFTNSSCENPASAESAMIRQLFADADPA